MTHAPYPIPARPRIPISGLTVGDAERRYVNEALDEGQISGGRFVDELERRFATLAGTRHGVATSNGTTALHLALVGMGVRPGDEVIVPSMTFVATANAVAYCGAKPVLVDVDPETWCIDPTEIARVLSTRTCGIIPVHLYGHPAQMEGINAAAERAGLWVLEDAAEALGTRFQGRHVGGLSRAAVFSLYGNKTITTGEGGIITTNDDTLAARLRILRAHGMSPERRYWHEVVGYNYRMTNLQAAFGVGQFERLERHVAKKRDIAAMYVKGLSGLSDITLPVERSWASNSYWMSSILFKDGAQRDRMARSLAGEGIETRPFFVPVHELPPYRDARACPVSGDIGRRGMSLPSGVDLTIGQVEEVVEAIRRHLPEA